MAANDFRSRILLAGKSTAGAAFDKTARASRKLAGTLGKIGKAGALAGLALGAAFGANAIRKSTQFGAAVSDLAAITGATGKELKFLSDQSKEFGRTTTLSASQAAEAFKLIASAKPDLLENVQALAAVTEQAILLSEASGVDLATAAATVGESLNQFGEGADQAARFVNVLAAGAKFGSSEIANTAEALRNAGVAGKQAGLSFEETNAAIQTLAASGIKGSDAGTKLRATLIKLQTQANDAFNPAVVGMNQALDNLAEANLDVTDRVKLFGERSLVVADILIGNRDLFDSLEEKITGTNIALEQATIRNDNLAGDMKQLKSAFEGLSIEVGEKFMPLFRDVVKIVTSVLNQFTDMSEQTEDVESNFEALDATIRTVAASFTVMSTIMEVIGKAIGGIAAAIVAVLSGEFSQAGAIVELAFADITDAMEKGHAKALAVITAKTPEVVKRVLMDPSVLEAGAAGGAALAEAAAQAARTAGERVAAEAAERELEAFAKKIERIREQNIGEEIVLAEKLAVELELINDSRAMDLLSLEEFLIIKENLIATADEKLRKLQMKGATAGQKFEQLTAKNKTKFILGELAAITAGAASENKALFRLNQAAGIANAIINTAEGITKMLSLPFPLNLAMAAVVAAAGAIQIGTIASAKFGGGTTPSFSASSPSIGGQPVDAVPGPSLDALLEDQGGGRTININISGIPEAGTMDAGVVRELIESINEELGDGATLNVAGNAGSGG